MKTKRTLWLLFLIVALPIFVSCKQGRNPKVDFDKAFDEAMKDFRNRKKYSFLDEKTLESIPDEKLLQAIIDYVADEILRGDYKNDYDIIKKQTNGIQYIWAVWGLEVEVNNGGFNQYFYNPSGQFAEEAAAGCRAIGAPEMAEIVEGAIKTHFSEMELYRKTKEDGTMEAFMDSYKESKLDQWDEEFFKYPDDLQTLMIQYIRSHYSEFVSGNRT